MRNNSGLIFIITSFLIFNLAATLLAGNPADANGGCGEVGDFSLIYRSPRLS
jgi:hypothetical protein